VESTTKCTVWCTI